MSKKILFVLLALSAIIISCDKASNEPDKVTANVDGVPFTATEFYSVNNNPWVLTGTDANGAKITIAADDKFIDEGATVSLDDSSLDPVYIQYKPNDTTLQFTGDQAMHGSITFDNAKTSSGPISGTFEAWLYKNFGSDSVHVTNGEFSIGSF